MFPDNGYILILFTVLISLDVGILFATVTVKSFSKRRFRVIARWERELTGAFSSENSALSVSLLKVPVRERLHFLSAWTRISRQIMPSSDTYSSLYALVTPWKLAERARRELSSHFFKRRSLGCELLEFVEPKAAVSLIRQNLERERNTLITLRLAATGLYLSGNDVMDSIVDSYKKGNKKKRAIFLGMLEKGDYQLNDWAYSHRDSPDGDIRRLVLASITGKPGEWTASFVASCMSGTDSELARSAHELAVEQYPSLIDTLTFLDSNDLFTRCAGARVFLSGDRFPEHATMFRLLRDDDLRSLAIEALRRKLRANGRYLDTLFDAYKASTDEVERSALADVLEMRLHYFLRRITGDASADISRLASDIVAHGYHASVITFLNGDVNESRRAAIHSAVLPFLAEGSEFLSQCRRYLNQDILSAWSIAPDSGNAASKRTGLSHADRNYLFILMAVTILLIPAGFLALYGNRFAFMYPDEIISAFLLYFQFAFAFYAVSINSVALALMLLSSLNISRQRSEWALADKRFLFVPGLLPSVSIIAPAFNEEKTIVQSIHSLLALEYPDFEVIVVNDGSNDRTLNVMIEHFNLELADRIGLAALPTAPVVGVYRSATIPNLVLVNKLNGGKADSLNAGISIASKQYVCSIDADSLLEPESLQRALFRSITTDRELAACGGNIIPVNGCITKFGSIQSIHFPKNRYAMYQTIEYLRSFITGRMGWAKIGGLLVISGAFGVFSRNRLLEVGGYLTGKGNFHRDTVGEDLEIVVRLKKKLTELKIPHLVDYAHNANCWTEVPEDIGSLVRQRDRWQRGLLETMTLHKSMLLRPGFGTVGMVSFPYFYLFEILGPFLEFEGYIFLVVSFFLGLLSPEMIAVMFAVVVLLGILVSSSALFLSERGVVYFQGKEFISVVFQCLVENFGYRQYISILRMVSFVSFLFKKNAGWQKLERKGFSGVPS